MRNFCLVLFLLFPVNSWWAVEETGVDSNLRGISAVPFSAGGGTAVTIWATGSNGVVMRSTDSGKTWQRSQIPDTETLDFRGVHALKPEIAYVMSSGEGAQSRIYKTTNGGKTWKLQYKGEQESFFLDALTCDDDNHCVALSDPVDGKFVLLVNVDGEHWTELPRDHMPAAFEQEGAFAASNSALCFRRTDIDFGTGGSAARVFASHDFGQTWTVMDTPILSGNASSGIFSLSCDGFVVAAVGGDYRDPHRAERNAAFSPDGGKLGNLQ